MHPDRDHDRYEAVRTDAVATVLGSLVASFAILTIGALAVLGFVGGTIPVVHFTLPGGLMAGLLWLPVLGTFGPLLFWALPLTLAMGLYRSMAWAFHIPATVPVAPRPALRRIHPRTRAV